MKYNYVVKEIGIHEHWFTMCTCNATLLTQKLTILSKIEKIFQR